MASPVSVVSVDQLPTAVITATTTWSEFPSLWGPLLGEVWAFLRAHERLLVGGGSSVMVYKDDTPSVEVGVLVSSDFAPAGRIVPSHLPGGVTAHAVHRGPYSDLGVTHDAVLSWCAANGRVRTGQRWEIYGDDHDDPSRLTTAIYWQLAE
jgi:effector-binding domain-containing protein